MPHSLIVYRLLLLLTLIVAVAGCGAAPEVTPTATLDPIALQGQTIFRQQCGSCHSLEPGAVIVGPSLYGIAATAATRVDGMDAREYILASVVNPDAYLVDGFDNLMPSTLGKFLTGEELDAIVAYLLLQ